MFKIILFGKNGQVSSNLLRILQTKPQFKIFNYDSKDIDFSQTNNLEIFLKTLPKADFIINGASYNEVDKAEDEPELANKINHEAVKIIANFCFKQNIKFIHYSTNYIFDGIGSEAYKEDNINNLKPLGVYGKTKLAGEKAIINSNCNYLILRLATVFSSKDNNFVTKISNLSKKYEDLKIVDDQVTNPTNARDAAQATIKIIEQILKKDNFTNNIYHIASNEAISYFEFTQKIVENLKKYDKNSLKVKNIIPVSSDNFITKAKRPLNGALNVQKIKQDFNIDINLNFKY